MSDNIEVIFLGVNDAGMQVYEWLCEREEVFVQSLLTTKEQLSVIKDASPDLVVSCGYRHIVPEEVLELPEMGCVNLHPAYLPYNRGANPNVWSIVEETPAGVTIHYMDPSLDTGDIIARRMIETDFADTGKDLHQRLEAAQVDLFKETWPDLINGEVTRTEQIDDEGTYHRTSEFKELCEIDGDETVRVKNFLNRLRALTFPPYDNAKIDIDDETYYIDIDVRRE